MGVKRFSVYRAGFRSRLIEPVRADDAFDLVAASRGALVALIVTTAGFAIVHGIHQGYAGVRFHLVTGFVFGLTLLATSSLVGAAAAHVAYNLAVLLGTVATRKKAFHDPLAVG